MRPEMSRRAPYLGEALNFFFTLLQKLGQRLSNVAILGRHVPNFGLVLNSTAQEPPARRTVSIVVTGIKVGLILELLIKRELIELLA